MTASLTERPAQPMTLPDRRLSRRPNVVGNRDPWHPVTNPNGLAGQLYPPVNR